MLCFTPLFPSYSPCYFTVYFLVVLGEQKNTFGVLGEEAKINLEKSMEDDEEEKDVNEKVKTPGIEPTTSEVEVEGANQCATQSQTKLRERNGTQ